MKRLIKAAQLFVAVLREVFDESAYARFLIRSKQESSAESYEAFCQERAHTHARRQRCC